MSVIPVPPAPDGADVWIVANSTLEPVSMRTTSPAVMPNVKFTLMFVSPGFAATRERRRGTADGALPTDVTVTVSAVPSGSTVSFAPARQAARALELDVRVAGARGCGERGLPAERVRVRSGFAAVDIAGAWLETSCEARCVGVSRATRSAARSANV